MTVPMIDKVHDERTPLLSEVGYSSSSAEDAQEQDGMCLLFKCYLVISDL